MKKVKLIFLMIFNWMMIGCVDIENRDKSVNIEFYSIDSTQTESDKLQYDLVNVFYQDSLSFLMVSDTLYSKANIDSLLINAGIKKGKFYLRKNWAMPIQYICKENQLILYKSDNSKCEICFDHRKKFVSYQDSVFEIDQEYYRVWTQLEGSDNLLSLPDYPLPNFKYFYKKTIVIK